MKNSRISLALKALRELGPRKLGLIALYKVGLKTGYFRWRAARDEQPSAGSSRMHRNDPHPLLKLPDPDTLLKIIGPDGLSQLKTEADEIVAGRVRLFTGPPVPLSLTPPGKLSYWIEYALGKSPFPIRQATQFPDPLPLDIKFIWEPARFGWTFTLGRAYHLTGDERYPEAFWRCFENFQQHNPVNFGPNWESAQEVALRLIAFAFAAQIFIGSDHSTANRQSQISKAIVSHANRIPPTLIYARSQNNNHLLSEAAGLITASLALPEHPQTKRWSTLGWKWFRRGLQTQIADDGAYMQHSTNYQRLMLQLSLWVCQVSDARLQEHPDIWHLILGNATRWLLALTDSGSGRTPNLGPNDGAYIFPLAVQPFHDYRPVLQAASRAFLGEPAFEPGVWDEMSLWLASEQSSVIKSQPSPSVDHGSRITASSPVTLHAPHSWAYFRAAKFSDRPGHADQLHLDLWFRGLNVAQDAGTYFYNADPPWDNALTNTAVHNTVMVDNCQQMTPAGRFLYLDWAQAEVLKRQGAEDGSWERIVASHDGYQRLGVMHVRSLTAYKDDRWLIEDRIQPITDDVQQTRHIVRLQWLLPDWVFEVRNAECGMRVKSPYGWVDLAVSCSFDAAQDRQLTADSGQSSVISLQLVRAGALLHGRGEVSPTWGWVSPTYSVKQPALSFVVTVVGKLPISLASEWIFPHG